MVMMMMMMMMMNACMPLDSRWLPWCSGDPIGPCYDCMGTRRCTDTRPWLHPSTKKVG